MTRETKSFLPKTIGGVKVPKKVRNGPFGELLASPEGQRLLAEAVAGRKADGETRSAPEPDKEARWPELPGSPGEAPAPAV